MKELPLKDDATKAAIDFLVRQGYFVSKTPVANIKADAYREGFERSGSDFNGECSTPVMVDNLIDDYRDQLRKREE